MSGDKFKFGRGYRWVVVNIDFATLYSEQIALYSRQGGMIPSGFGFDEMRPQRFENLQRNNERDTIVLTRRDLSRGRQDKPRNLIDWYDFSEQLTRQEFMRASIVIFMDDDGNTRTIKNRYGPTN